MIILKALFFDLDDTLLHSDKYISERNRKAIIQCKNQGMLIGYITVRSPRKINIFLNGLPCDCIANYNGALVYADGKLIAQNNIPYSEAVSFIEKLLQDAPDINLSAYCEPYGFRKNKASNTITNETLGDSIKDIPPTDFQRIRLVLEGYEDIDFSRHATESMLYQVSVHNTAIVTHCKATKENALKSLMDYYNLTAGDVISFGDDINDIEMLRLSGVGVAMGNALDEVKKAADYVTLTNDEDGVAEYIERFIL